MVAKLYFKLKKCSISNVIRLLKRLVPGINSHMLIPQLYCSDFRIVLFGVPQWSILGPLLYLVYVNDIKDVVKCKLLLYVDDSALLMSRKDVLAIERILSVELGAVNEWLCKNMLSLHLSKTQSIIFGLKKCISKCSDQLHMLLIVTCYLSVVASESEVTYLGAI